MPGEGFPQKKIKERLTEAQLEVIEEFGAPDYLRVWWDKYGNIKTVMDVHRQVDKKEYARKPMTWLYQMEGIEIFFADSKNFTSKPIETKIKILMEFGDPENRFVTTPNDVYRETWQYYSAGVIFKFNRDGEVLERKDYQGTGAWIKN